METKENLKTQTLKEKIDDIWKNNPKIPFMQSKDILEYGYIEGRKSIQDKTKDPITQTTVKNPIESNKNDSFTGTIKEFINKTNQIINKEKKSKSEKIKTEIKYINGSEFDITESVYKEVCDIYNFMKEKANLYEVFQFIKSHKDQLQQKLNELKYNARKIW